MRKQEVYLGISPGTHFMGIVFYHNQNFIYWRIRNFAGPWSERKRKKILRVIIRLLDNYQPARIAIKIPDANRASKRIKKLIKDIELQAKTRHVSSYCYTLEEMERYVSREKRVSKRMLIEHLTQKYPMLMLEYKRATRWQGNAFEKIFEAAGAIELSLGE